MTEPRPHAMTRRDLRVGEALPGATGQGASGATAAPPAMGETTVPEAPAPPPETGEVLRSGDFDLPQRSPIFEAVARARAEADLAARAAGASVTAAAVPGSTPTPTEWADQHPEKPLFHPPAAPAGITPVDAPDSGAGEEPLTDASATVRHAARGSLGAARSLSILVTAAVLVAAGATAVTGAVASGAPTQGGSQLSAAMADAAASDLPAESSPAAVPTQKTQPPPPTPVATVVAAPASIDICADPDVQAAIATGDDTAVITAAGGAEPLRAATADGTASCIDLADPARMWAVINKTRSFNPPDYRPADLVQPAVRNIEGGALRSDAAAALAGMVSAAAAAGVGEIALESGFRSYQTQVTSYGNQVSSKGVEQADLVSARPGFSEHQTGLTADVVACSGGCGTLDDLAPSPQGAWIAAHSWEFGWIVRYEDGQTDTTGYLAEPWHLRYIGPDLAKAYHDGGWHSLEAFWGLPAAPDYLG